MGARGCVPVRIVLGDPAITAQWLREIAIPEKQTTADTVLTPNYNRKLALHYCELAEILEKVARRKRRQTSFSVLIPRELAASMRSAIPVFLPTFSYSFSTPEQVSRVAKAMSDASSRKRGRPELSTQQRAERTESEYRVDERHRKRIKRRECVDAAWSAWSDAVFARGETLLTTLIPFPKI